MGIYKTNRGAKFDMGAFVAKHGTTRAIGNVAMNGNGDLLNEDGTIKETRDSLIRKSNQNKNSPSKVSLKPAMPDTFLTPEEIFVQPNELPKNDLSQENNKPRKSRKLIEEDDSE